MAGAELASAEATVSRIAECETAVRMERDMRKEMEAELAALREEREVLHSLVDTAVQRELAASGASGSFAAVATLDEKVRECGRLILRMGGDLMEEVAPRPPPRPPPPAPPRSTC